ncbi:MAG TPA: outer membrane beta-barrel protein [Bacteroidales bacterium]|nr:outer membrane beta-barrel protein [Bacteroidales bacterium]
MKKFSAILLFALIAIPAMSQVKFGIKAGASTTTVPKYESNGTVTSLKDATWGFHAGIFVRAGLGPVYLQPEVYFASNTYEYNVQTTPVSQILDQSFNRLEIPVLVGVKLGPIRLNAGPSATVPIGTPEALVNDPDFEDLYRGTTFGYQAGLGIDIFNTITLDARYGGSLAKKFGDTVDVGGANFKLDDRQQSFILSLGIMF